MSASADRVLAVKARVVVLSRPRHERERIVFLVGCGKAKGTEPTKARALYTSPLFRKSLELAELVGQATYVLSGAHGLVELDAVLAPYDHTLKLAGKLAREQWALEVVRQLEARAMGTTKLIPVILAGESYAAPLVDEIERRRLHVAGLYRWASPLDLLRGLQIGERLAALNRAIRVALDSKPQRVAG